ncbi:MAG: hypothetical protein QNJ56_07720 [Gammaproteobacteria bacterium]|nr:hypothetical protein [Gammaproteobacteria bacterium]
MMHLDANITENKKYVFSVYILQALSFVLGITAIIGVIINYIKEDDLKGSWLESHFIWQKRTFWYGLLWVVLGSLTTAVLIGWLVLFMVTCWLIYRIAKGWIYLVDNRELYVQ